MIVVNKLSIVIDWAWMGDIYRVYQVQQQPLLIKMTYLLSLMKTNWAYNICLGIPLRNVFTFWWS